MKSEFFDHDEATSSGPEAPAAESENADVPAPREETSGTEGTDGTPADAREVDELRDRYLRLAAEYDNFRKRTDRERVEARDRAQGQLVEKLLDPLDDLQRVAQLTPEGSTVEAVLEGIRMVERKFIRALEGAGLEAVNPRGERFDPEVHEALMTTSTDNAEQDDTVGEVFQTGYVFRGSLLRPARVQVRQHGG
jgi:molecular chaperone GrpE